MNIVKTHVGVNFLVRQLGGIIYSIDFVDLWMKCISLLLTPKPHSKHFSLLRSTSVCVVQMSEQSTGERVGGTE